MESVVSSSFELCAYKNAIVLAVYKDTEVGLVYVCVHVYLQYSGRHTPCHSQVDNALLPSYWQT